MDPKLIDWEKHLQFYTCGTQRYYFKMDNIDPQGDQMPLISKNKYEYFEDIKFAYFSRPLLTPRMREIRAEVFRSSLFHEFV